MFLCFLFLFFGLWCLVWVLCFCCVSLFLCCLVVYLLACLFCLLACLFRFVVRFCVVWWFVKEINT